MRYKKQIFELSTQLQTQHYEIARLKAENERLMSVDHKHRTLGAAYERLKTEFQTLSVSFQRSETVRQQQKDYINTLTIQIDQLRSGKPNAKKRAGTSNKENTAVADTTVNTILSPGMTRDYNYYHFLADSCCMCGVVGIATGKQKKKTPLFTPSSIAKKMRLPSADAIAAANAHDITLS